MTALPDFSAYNGTPDPIPTGDTTPCVAITGNIGQMRDGGKAALEVADAQTWRAQANGPLLSRMRFDVTAKLISPHTFHDEGWDPSFVARITESDFLYAIIPWYNAGWTFVWQHPLIDVDWFTALGVGVNNEVPCPYVNLDHTNMVMTPNNFVLRIHDPACQAWIFSAAEALRSRYGKDFLGIDGWECALKEMFWRYPQTERRTPEDPVNGGCITDTPFGAGEFEAGYIACLEGLYERGFKILVSHYPKGADADWLGAAKDDLLGTWDVVPQP